MTAADFFRALPISGKGLALLGSVSVHAAVALAAARGAPHAAPNASPANAAEVAALDLTLTEALTQPGMVPEPASAPASAHHHHDYPVPPDHDATPHDPSIRHLSPLQSVSPPQRTPASSAASTPALIDAPAPATPRFVMTVGPSTHALAGSSAELGGGEAASVSAQLGPASEASVDTPAKLLSGSSPSYTHEAEVAGVEADVPLEIVVDRTGSVVGARALAHVGYGLDEAALQSVRGYRFSPAQRSGRALAVRMRWLMRFQLR